MKDRPSPQPTEALLKEAQGKVNSGVVFRGQLAVYDNLNRIRALSTVQPERNVPSVAELLSQQFNRGK